ncbi:MAG: hypothetical protein IJ220_04530 [Clostridia bacterium]|nr:hypothetical protein [Clostridia bacterium]
MEKKKFIIGKIILIILAIIILGILIHTTRNYIIISKLQDTFKQYANVDNYHIKIAYDNEQVGHVETNYYRKDNKKAYFIENTNLSGDITKMLTFDNGKRVDFFSDSIEGKNAYLGKGASPDFAIDNGIMVDSFIQKLFCCFVARIRSMEYNGKDCYEIKNFLTANYLYDENEVSMSIIDKETALEIARKWDGTRLQLEERLTEINTVDDSVFIEPNIAEYDIKENNT